MTDSDADHSMINEAPLPPSLYLHISSSSFLDVDVGYDLTIEEYIDRIQYTVACDAKMRLGINDFVNEHSPGLALMHPNVLALRSLAWTRSSSSSSGSSSATVVASVFAVGWHQNFMQFEEGASVAYFEVGRNVKTK